MVESYGGKFIMIPMIWIGGSTSLEMFAINGRKTLLGEQILRDAALETEMVLLFRTVLRLG